ncbi:hypothetical protein [Thaumasiovibrio subtropicus]|uniref:hypothetical protein n=1 Tax=Thaumasiovibrio subtropicus TaxID=1891207 RepID=UPI000B355C4F|nr:hypothetical protein [Thaumasiovibrio subtropicus]
MDVNQCWTQFLQAEHYMAEGCWTEARELFDGVLAHLPAHIDHAISCDQTKPCQLACLIGGLKDAAVAQSTLLNKIHLCDHAYEILNQTYAQLQFIALEPTENTAKIDHLIEQHSENLFRHIAAFCVAQRSAKWMLELDALQKAHHHFASLKSASSYQAAPHTLN